MTMKRDRAQATAAARLSLLLDELEAVLPALAGCPSLPAHDWQEIDRRLAGLRSTLAGVTRRRSAPRTRPATRARTSRTGGSGTLL